CASYVFFSCVTCTSQIYTLSLHDALPISCSLLKQLAGGVVLDSPSTFDVLDRTEKQVRVDLDKVNARLGTEITGEEVEGIFKNLRFNYTVELPIFDVSIPTRRGDITIFEDMLEEIARMYGYDHLPYTLPTSPSKPGGLTTTQQ